jgi:hypothetical protein
MSNKATLTNQTGIHTVLAVWLAHRDYSAPVGPKTISVTTLLKPVRQIILSNRIVKEDTPTDVASLVKAQIGHALHLGVETAWKSHLLGQTLASLGYPERIVKQIKINPDPSDEDCIPLFFEQRKERQINGWTISGQYDIVFEGQVQDVKSTSVYTYIKARKTDDYALQGSIYRWIDAGQPYPVFKQDTMLIHFIFTDFSAGQSYQPDYPPSQLYSQKIPLLGINQTQSFITTKLDLLEEFWDAPEEALPECTEEELWRSEPVFKYYKNPEKRARATKNFDNYQEAYTRLAEDGHVGVVEEVKGKVKACLYCSAFSECKQKDRLIFDGSLEV